MYSLSGHSNCIESVAISQNRKFVVSGSMDNTIKIWNIETMKEKKTTKTIKAHNSGILCISISQDGQFIVSGGNRTIKVWKVENGDKIFEINGHS